MAYRMTPTPVTLKITTSDFEGHFCCLKPF